jgi:retinol dehydrogenase-13
MIPPPFQGVKTMSEPKQPKTAVVTGGTGAIGGAIALKIAAKGYRLVIVARDEGKAKRVVHKIIQATGNPLVSFELAELSRFSSIQQLGSRWDGPVHILVNNAAVTPRIRQETPEGIELQFATNVMGYFWMTEVFRPFLAASPQSRIVDVASYWAGDLDLSDLEFKNRHYTNGVAYRQSKQANRMLVVGWAERLEVDGIKINACHPGDVNSTLSNNLGFGGSQTPDQGADTPVYLATTPSGIGTTGKYFEHENVVRCRFGEKEPEVSALFEICQNYNR